MTYLLVGMALASILGAWLWLWPTPQERRQARLRKRASTLGLRVKLAVNAGLPPPLLPPLQAVYQYPCGQSGPLASWQRVGADWKAPEAVRPCLDALPAGVSRVDLQERYISAVWDEQGNETALAQLAEQLQAIARWRESA